MIALALLLLTPTLPADAALAPASALAAPRAPALTASPAPSLASSPAPALVSAPAPPLTASHAPAPHTPAPHALPAAPPLAPMPAFFQRTEPNLQAGASALADGNVDAAIESFRAAQPKTDDERAIVEYDVGAALLARAALAAAPDPAASTPGAPAPKLDAVALDDAIAVFERAYGIAKDRRLKSEAALATGNAAAFASKLDDAIAHYRQAVVADPTNARAKTNLKRTLDAKRAQPPPPPEQDGDSDDDKKPKDGEDEKPKDGDDKKPKDGEDEKPKDGDDKKPKDGEDEKEPKDPKGEPQQPEDSKEEGAQQDKKLKKEQARRLLEMMRARERPLTPLQMRGEAKAQPAKQGKDW